MPELPEVETIVRDLQSAMVGEKFVNLTSFFEKAVYPGLSAFDDLVGKRVESVGRRGKFLIIFFDGDDVLVLHLRMSGRIVLSSHGEAQLPHERNRLDFEKSSLRFCDPRKFGRIWLAKISDYEAVSGISRLGVEPFGDEIDAKYFTDLFGKKRGAVKKNLLDQSLIAGIGNIYADEACFYAGIRPERETSSLSRREFVLLFEAVLKALNQGIINRGTSISDYHDAYGKSGKNQELLYVYGRGGKECIGCKEILVKAKVAGRGTVYCRKCQR